MRRLLLVLDARPISAIFDFQSRFEISMGCIFPIDQTVGLSRNASQGLLKSYTYQLLQRKIVVNLVMDSTPPSREKLSVSFCYGTESAGILFAAAIYAINFLFKRVGYTVRSR